MPLDVDTHNRRIYQPDGAVLDAFLFDRARVSVIRGPIGSGTSSCCCYKIGMLASEQEAGPDGRRRSRWAVIRNSYPDLKNTTVKTWLDWFPEEVYGTFIWQRPMTHVLRWPVRLREDEPVGEVELEVLFLALDDEADIRKLRSLELTGVWFNEAEFIPKSIFDEAQSRTSRFPPMRDGGPTWFGVIADMNAPGEEHWIPQYRGEVPIPEEIPEDQRAQMVWPQGWSHFEQPAAVTEVRGVDNKVTGYAVNPKAENLRWLAKDYYTELLKGKSKDWIDSRLRNVIVTVMDGDPVWPMFARETHVVQAALAFNPAYRVFVSLDFGRRPTALIAQEVNGRVQVQREFRMYGVAAATFAPALKRFLTQHYGGVSATSSYVWGATKIEFTGDPKGQDKGQADERTAYDIFAAHGMRVTPSPVKQNNLETRLEVVSYALQHAPNGHSRVLISGPGCPTLVAGMGGKYHLKKLDTGDAEPVKDKYSDPCDCLGYLLVYLGDGREMIGLKPMGQIAPVRIARPQRSLRRVG